MRAIEKLKKQNHFHTLINGVLILGIGDDFIENTNRVPPRHWLLWTHHSGSWLNRSLVMVCVPFKETFNCSDHHKKSRINIK